MTLAFQIASALGVIAGLAFIAAYAWKARRLWHHTALGWHLMGVTSSLVVALALIFTSSVWGPIPSWVWLLIVANITGLLIQRTWLLVSTNKHDEEFLR